MLACRWPGAVGIECRLNDSKTRELLAKLNNDATSTCVLAERAMNMRLEGGCQVPIGSYAIWQDDKNMATRLGWSARR